VKYAIYSNKLLYEWNQNDKIPTKVHIENVINKGIPHCFENEIINCYNDYFQLLKGKCLEGITEFEKLFKNTNIDKYIEDLIN
jgi:hypothetical protein